MSERTGTDKTADAGKLGVSAELLEVLVCPVDHGSLEVVDEGLRCRMCQRVYPVRDGIPSMVVESPST